MEKKLKALQARQGDIRVMIVGLGSVGGYLLDYLLSLSGLSAVIVAGRNKERMEPAVNIARVSALIRGVQLPILTLDGSCDLEEPESVAACMARYKPDIVVNCSRVYAGLKYGSISWQRFRAYGIWAPLAVKYSAVVAQAAADAISNAIVINTSYSDAVIPWLTSAGVPAPDFGSGNLNHLIPRIQLAAAALYNIQEPTQISATLATAHFHDVVISKEGQTEGLDPLLSLSHLGQPLTVDTRALYGLCAIPMPTDQKRNMMNASSNFAIIKGLIAALSGESVLLHIAGAFGEIGGYPVRICGTSAAIDTEKFTLEAMRAHNRQSIALDGIENVEKGVLTYTDRLIQRVYEEFRVDLPKRVPLSERESVAELLIERIIKKA